MPSPDGNAKNASIQSIAHMSKYNQLLLVLEEMKKDVRPSYAGSKASVERLRRGISNARLLVHESMIENELERIHNSRYSNGLPAMFTS